MASAFDHLLVEAGRRREAKAAANFGAKAELLYSMLLPVQRRVADDPSNRIAIRCPRRTGKTTGVRARLARRCLRFANSACLYIALTRPKAEELMWMGSSGLKAICRKLGLVESVDVHFHNAKLLLEFSNGSYIQLAGASTKDEIDKFRGGEYDEVWIDEAKSYPAKLFSELLEEALEPALMTRDGVLGMIGTPGNILDGKFYDVTKPGSVEAVPYDDEEAAAREAARKSSIETPDDDLDDDVVEPWSFHTWTLQDNTAEPHQWRRALRIKARNGWSDSNPRWQREYLGNWAADHTDYVYKFRAYTDDGQPWNLYKPVEPTRANPYGLPGQGPWDYVFGMDLGASDPFALEVLAYEPTGRTIYQAFEYVAPPKSKMTPTQIGELLQGVIDRTGYPLKMCSDGSHLGGGYLEELKQRFGLVIQAAPRAFNEKLDAIEIMNGDLIDGHFKLRDDGRPNILREQFQTLQYDDDGVHERKGQRNDAADAAVMGRRVAMTHLAEGPGPEPPKPGTVEYVEAKVQADEDDAAGLNGDELQTTGVSDLDLFLGHNW